ncbi:alpha/beta fold hydrolase [Halocatena halophila]|uniref:alpha/beta fold hydrolase n=1 Tax=Halocatena halophila TaxID=2814576 RepID=UPI002ED17C57
MPRVQTDGGELRYETTGSGPTVAFVNDLSFGVWQWAFQQPALAGPFETLAFDYRGAGDSTGGPITRVAEFVDDLATVLADHGARRVHLVGAGLGGMVALEYARQFGRARSLVLFGTTQSGDTIVNDAIETMCAQDESALDPCLDRETLESAPEINAQIQHWRESDDATGRVRDGQLAAMKAYSLDRPYDIDQHALIVHGNADPVVPVDAGRELAAALPRGTFEPIDGKHMARIENAAHANDLLVGFLESHADL